MRLGSARALACCFRRPCRNEHRPRRRIAKVKKSAMTRASSPARAARALPGDVCVAILQKILARDASQSETRTAMRTFARSRNRASGFIAICVFAAFLWALALSASPQLHQRVHNDANRAEHTCAATMIASGSYDHASHPPLVSADALVPQFSKIPALTPCWVQSPFLGACIFEHAPPARF